MKNSARFLLTTAVACLGSLAGCGGNETSAKKYPSLNTSQPVITYGSGANQLADSICVSGGTNLSELPSPLIVFVDNTTSVSGVTVDWYIDSDRDLLPDSDNQCAGGGGFSTAKGGGKTYPTTLPNGGFSTTTDSVGRAIVYYTPSVPWPHKVMAYAPTLDNWVYLDISTTTVP